MLPPIKISLTLPERVGMFIICQNKKYGDHRLMYLLKQAKEELMTKDKEIKEYEISPRAGGGINWNEEKAQKAKTFSIPALIHQMVEDELRQLSKDGKITDDLVDIANKMLGIPDDDGKEKPKNKKK